VTRSTAKHSKTTGNTTFDRNLHLGMQVDNEGSVAEDSGRDLSSDVTPNLRHKDEVFETATDRTITGRIRTRLAGEKYDYVQIDNMTIMRPAATTDDDATYVWPDAKQYKLPPARHN
jgi:hypothetical protein